MVCGAERKQRARLLYCLPPMNARLQYEIRGWAYWARCLNPLRDTIAINHLPLGLRLRAYKRDAVGRGLYRRRIHEPALTELLLARFAGPGERNFIDVGANIGYFTALMSKLAGPSGRVLAVEPEPRNFRVLRQNLALNGLTNVEVHACALGERDGTTMLGLYKAANLGRHSILNVEAKQKVEVPLKTLNSLVGATAQNVRSWSLVKVDVEGYEAFVIDGAGETLPRIEMLVMEFSPGLLRRAGREPAAAIGALCRNFSRFRRIEGAELREIKPEDCLGTDSLMELVLER